MRKYDHWIGGAWSPPASGAHRIRHVPADGSPAASFAAGDARDVDEAVRAAAETFRSGRWSDLPGAQRAALLLRWADLLQEQALRLSKIEAEECGKPIRAARGEIDYSIELLRYAASLAWEIPGRALTHDGPDKLGLVSYEPRGVVGMILPWNFPAVTLFQKLPYALAAGCTAVIKPSEFTSGTTLEAAALAGQAGLPAGAVNVVTGTGEQVGQALLDHPSIDMISFTGSTRVGRSIARQAGERLKHVALELGGKGANIVFADANIDAALDGALAGFTINKGEECCAGSRLLLEESIADEFLERLVARAERLEVGPPDDERTEMGPLIHEDHLGRVAGYVATGQKEGATLLTGGYRMTDGELGKGVFYAPTIFSNVTPAMTIFREEIFGPVASVVTFRGVDEAVEIANDTTYGLANGVWTRDVNKALAVSRRLRSGTVYVNTYLETLPQLPFGGMKESGLGRENGKEGLLEFMETKATFIKLESVA